MTSMDTPRFGVNPDFERSSFFQRKPSQSVLRDHDDEEGGDGGIKVQVGDHRLSILSLENGNNLSPKMTNEYLKQINLWEAASVVGSQVGHLGRTGKSLMSYGGLVEPNGNFPSQLMNTKSSSLSGRQTRNYRRKSIVEDDSLPAEFCKNTSLHGLKYIGQKKIHLCEK